jgi:hypothetical protein
MRFTFIGALLASVALAAPISSGVDGSLADIGLEADPQGGLPLLKLPYGTYRAKSYDKATDVLLFFSETYINRESYPFSRSTSSKISASHSPPSTTSVSANPSSRPILPESKMVRKVALAYSYCRALGSIC